MFIYLETGGPNKPSFFYAIYLSNPTKGREKKGCSSENKIESFNLMAYTSASYLISFFFLVYSVLGLMYPTKLNYFLPSCFEQRKEIACVLACIAVECARLLFKF